MRIIAHVGAFLALAACAAGSRMEPEARHGFVPELEAIEAETGGRIGVSLIDGQGREFGSFRANERFAMCSTFKAALAGMVLEADQKGELSLDDRIDYETADLLDHAPAAKANVARGYMTIGELAAAGVTLSDNTAANLLLTSIGGPAGFTSRIRAWDDEHTRLDRTEPTLNENAVGDPRDTTTPWAMAETLRKLLLGDILTRDRRAMLDSWLAASRTGNARIRAGLPEGWIAGDKTGSCGTAFNDIAHLRSPVGKHYVLSIFLDRPAVSATHADAAIARATEALLDGLE